MYVGLLPNDSAFSFFFSYFLYLFIFGRFADENLITVKEDNEQNKPSGKKKIKREKGNSFDVSDVQGKMV